LLPSATFPAQGQFVAAGTVQVCVEGAWTFVCGRDWSDMDAAIACRQLGYSPTGKDVIFLTCT